MWIVWAFGAIAIAWDNDPEWLLPNMYTREAFIYKFSIDSHMIMKPTIGSKFGRIQRFLPDHVMVDLFAIAATIVCKTPHPQYF